MSVHEERLTNIFLTLKGRYPEITTIESGLDMIALERGELEKDKDRLNWLEKNPNKILLERLPGSGGGGFRFRFLQSPDADWSHPTISMREAIDAAMQEGREVL